MTNPDSGRTFLLPGMGADGRLFPGVWDALPGVVRLDWSECAAARDIGGAADVLIRKHRIGSGDRLVGISLGGMVACEIASRVPVARVVLIASTTHPRGVSRFLKFIHPLIRIVPIRFTQWCVRRSPWLVHRMYAATDPDFLRAMCFAIFRWEGLRGEVPVKPLRLHGRRDSVIPCPAQTDMVFEGGHMFMIKQAAECVEAVRARYDW